MTTHPHLEGLYRLAAKWREDASGGEGYNYTAYEEGRIAEKRKSADELEAALAALPGGGVDDAMVWRSCNALHGSFRVGNLIDAPDPLAVMRTALAAAPAAPAPDTRVTGGREDAKDAARYRHVRRDPSMLLHLKNSEFDAAIDAALQAANGGAPE